MTDKLTPAELFDRVAQATLGLAPGRQYRHLKSGKKYMALAACLREHDLEPCVIYTEMDALSLGYAVSFCRPATEFFKKFALEAPA